jgi:hypothetical protein
MGNGRRYSGSGLLPEITNSEKLKVKSERVSTESDSDWAESSESTLERESPAKRGGKQTKVWTPNGIYKLPLVSTSGEQKAEIGLQPKDLSSSKSED